MYKYKGYTYDPWEDREEDNLKVFHEVYATSPDGKQEVESRSMPLSPYANPSEEHFRMWIDCGQPSAKDMGLNGNAYCQDIVKYYNQWLDNEIDKQIFGVDDV